MVTRGMYILTIQLKPDLSFDFLIFQLCSLQKCAFPIITFCLASSLQRFSSHFKSFKNIEFTKYLG